MTTISCFRHTTTTLFALFAGLASGLGCQDDHCGDISDHELARTLEHPGPTRELGIRLAFASGLPTERDLSRCLSLKGEGVAQATAAKRAADTSYTLLLVDPGANAVENEAVRALVKAVVDTRLEGTRARDRIALVRWADEVTQVAPFLADKAMLEERSAAGLVPSGKAIRPATDALTVAGRLLAQVGGPGPLAQRTLMVVSARPVPELTPEAIAAAAPGIVGWLGPAGEAEARVGAIPAGLRFAVAPGAGVQAAATLSRRIDAYARHGHYALGMCGATAGGNIDLQAGAGPARTVKLAAALPEHAGGSCQAAPVAAGRTSYPRRIELLLTPEQRAAADVAYRAGQLNRQTRSAEPLPDKFDLSVRMSPASQPVKASAHYRGESTYSCPRRNYSVNLDGKTPRAVFPGFAASKFHLLSLCRDRLYLRNLTVMTMMAAEGIFPVPHELVQLVVDGQEQGVYLLVENVSDSLRVQQSGVTSVIRRYKIPTGPGTYPELRWASAEIGDESALASYESLVSGTQGLAGEKLETALRQRLNLDQYLLWTAVLNSVQSGDYVDEVFFYATETTGPDGKRGAHHQVMAWDQDDTFTACHFGGQFALQDPAGLLFCAESELDRRIFGDPLLYKRYAEVLERWLERYPVERFARTLRGTADRLLGQMRNAKVLAAMSELTALHAEAPTSFDVTQQLMDTDLQLLVTQFEDRRNLLRARLESFKKNGVPDPLANVPEMSTPTGPGELVPLRTEPVPAPVDAARVAPIAGGTRLKARIVEFEGGRSSLGFVDSKLGESCAFARTPDGSVRCLPSVRSNATTLRYGDVGCTRPVLLTSTTACDPLNHVFVRAADGCPSPQLAYRRGKKLEQTTTYGRNAMGVCTPQQIFLSPTDGIFELEEIPLTTFVGAAVKPGMGDRIVPELLEAEDGSQAVLGWRDSMRAHSCLPRPAADGMFRCLPTEGGTSIASLFSDDACTTPVALGETSGCTSIPYALRTEVMRCSARVTVFQGGAKVSAAYQRSGGRCVMINITGVSTYTHADEIPAPQFMAMPPSGAVGLGRLRPLASTNGTAAMLTGPLYDDKLKLACGYAIASDGTPRCVPLNQAASVGTYFADAACMLALVSTTTGCDTPTLATSTTLVAGMCPARVTAYRVGAPYRGQLYTREGVRCTLPRMPPQGESFFMLGPPMPPAEMAELKVVER